MNAGEIVGFIGGVLLILGVIWRLIRAIYRLTRVGETALTRLGSVETQVTNVEAQLQNNGGNSARDVLDKIHAVAIQNAEAVAEVKDGQRKAAALAGEAATLAGTADQRIKELADIATQRHRDNTSRLERLEGAAREERIRREFYLATLRELYGIELVDPDD